MPMDYFIWVVRSPEKVFVVDTGFTEPKRRGRTFLKCPAESLGQMGIDATSVSDVVLTHMHYDHCGGLELFPNARFHVQEREVAHATGRYMSVGCLGHGYHCEDVLSLVRMNFEGRVVFYDVDRPIAEGITLHRIGGHTPGLQCVRVETARGVVVLASDSVHYYEQMEMNKVYSSVVNVPDMVDGYATLRRLAGPGGDIVPGHDPLVMQRYPAYNKALEGVVARIA